MGAASNRLAVLVWVLLAGLVAIRIPSLVEPAGADQALYAYVGQRILAGDVPYRDAWDQKPPGVHLTYAALIACWPHESVVAGADLVVAVLTALALVALGRRLAPATAAGELAAGIYLLLGNPAFGRLGGVRVRAQCEVFIGLAVAGAVLAAWRAARGDGIDRLWLLAAGALVGIAVVFKYNAAVYGLPVFALVAQRSTGQDGPAGHRVRRLLAAVCWLSLGAMVPVMMMLAWLAGAGALDDLYRATIIYNVQYSGETYGGRLAMLRYLMTFPIRYARVDPLWFVGGLGTLVLIAGLARDRLRPIPAVVPIASVAPVVWLIASCFAIAINGSRGLPQYFVQAGPALALVAGLAAAWTWRRLASLPRLAIIVIVAVGLTRVASFPKLFENTRYDLQELRGEMSRTAYLSKFGNPDSGDKYSALAVAELASLIRDRTQPTDPVFVFGFSPWAYVGSGRVSPSRFFWSRPVIIGFEQGRRGYGVDGLLETLRARSPRLVVLQERDWDPDGTNSADFFLADPSLSAWLHANYVRSSQLHNFQIWTRRDAS